MRDLYDDVRQFHLKFNLPTADDQAPKLLDDDTLRFRMGFLIEELEEFRDGARANDLAQMADALVDLVYVALGTAHMMGLPWNDLWDEVQRANMQKVRARRASQSKRGSPLDVVKPDGWTPPDIEGVLERAAEAPRRAYPVPKVGTWVKTVVDFCGVPAGTIGVVDEDYGTGIMVAWNLSNRPLPRNYFDPESGKPRPWRYPAAHPKRPTRDGFDKATELKFLEVVSW